LQISEADDPDSDCPSDIELDSPSDVSTEATSSLTSSVDGDSGSSDEETNGTPVKLQKKKKKKSGESKRRRASRKNKATLISCIFTSIFSTLGVSTTSTNYTDTTKTFESSNRKRYFPKRSDSIVSESTISTTRSLSVSDLELSESLCGDDSRATSSSIVELDLASQLKKAPSTTCLRKDTAYWCAEVDGSKVKPRNCRVSGFKTVNGITCTDLRSYLRHRQRTVTLPYAGEIKTQYIYEDFKSDKSTFWYTEEDFASVHAEYSLDMLHPNWSDKTYMVESSV